MVECTRVEPLDIDIDYDWKWDRGEHMLLLRFFGLFGRCFELFFGRFFERLFGRFLGLYFGDYGFGL